MPGTFSHDGVTSSPVCSRALKSSPKILSARLPLVPVSVSPTLSSIGCEKFQVAPGHACPARDSWRRSVPPCSCEIPGAIRLAASSRRNIPCCRIRRCRCRRRAGRLRKPPVFTSGKAARTQRAPGGESLPSVRLVLCARVPRAQMAPSSKCGRNSAPMTPLKPR